jgi:hypothetical protein
MAIGGLTFRPRRGTASAVEVDGGVVLTGEVEWVASGSRDDVDALAHALGQGIVDRAGDTAVLLRFGNVVGTFRVPGRGVLEVRSGKWSEATFDAMLADLSRIAGALPFLATSVAGLAQERTAHDRDDVLLHAFLYVRHIVLSRSPTGALVPALTSLLRDPHRRFDVEREHVRLHDARRIDARGLAAVASGAGAFVEAPRALRATALSSALGGCIPERIDVPRARHTVDTAENRFVRAFLDEVMALVDRVEVRAREKSGAVVWQRIADDCRHVRAALVPVVGHGVWRDVGAMTHVPLSSSVLQRRREYRDVLRHHLALRASARLPVDADVVATHLLGVKDIATMYELWCFFAVVREVEALRGPPVRAGRLRADEVQVAVERGLAVVWSDGVEVAFNVAFTKRATGERRSSSLLLRPDIVVRVPDEEGKASLHVLDAKLRVQRVREESDDSDCDSDGPGGLGFQRSDVAKMHAYRDALPSVRSAFVLYPGDDEVIHRALEAGASDVDAVGALPLVPGGSTAGLRSWLRRLLP